MIFLTVGSQLPFDRLVAAVDSWAQQHPQHRVLAQIGQSELQPRALEVIDSLSPAAYQQMLRDSSLVVGHVGMGTIINCLTESRPMLLMPRLSRLGETRNDHQVDTANRFQRFSTMHIAWEADQVGDQLDALTGAAAPVDSAGDIGLSPQLEGVLRQFVSG